MNVLNTDLIVTHQLGQLNQSLSEEMNGHCILINSAIIAPLDDILRTELERSNAFSQSKTRPYESI